MSKNITEALWEMQVLTKKNLEILQAINNSFYTKSEHLSVEVDDKSFIIPSFLALESKINTLQSDFENLVNAPKTGVAAFNFDGSTQTIELKGFSNTPDQVYPQALGSNPYNLFDFEKNPIFKDFCTPKPYVKLDLGNVTNDITQLHVKKVILKSQNIKNSYATKFQKEDEEGNIVEKYVSVGYKYSDLVKELEKYQEGIDYEEYDSIYNMPIRSNMGDGTYHVVSINKNYTDSNLSSHYSLTLDSTQYWINDGTINRTLRKGDYLVSLNDKCRLKIEDVKVSTKTIDVLVEDGAYIDLTTYDENNELGTLKFLDIQDFDQYKYINIPLEEDQYVFIFVAPIERTLIQSSWGNGIFFNVWELKCAKMINGKEINFKTYYDTFVHNVGDTLFGLTDLFGESFVNYTSSQFNILQEKPTLDKNALKVLEINKHLSSSSTVAELYKLYENKQNIKSQIEDTQSQIDSLNELLATISFQDTLQKRPIYEGQLNALNKTKKDLNDALREAIKEISTASTDSITPLDNPKYRIRGFFDYLPIEEKLKKSGVNTSIVKIDVQYRYKNAEKSTGSAETIGGGIFSDWNEMKSITKMRTPQYEGVQIGTTYHYGEDNTNINEISFNQIDIPISQGESVDIRLRLVYSVGQPFVNTYSSWSDVVNIEFPNELKRNVTLLKILEENNEDVRNNRIVSTLQEEGVTSHVDDALVDQDIRYLHKPESISSGFRTQDGNRRIISLKDKLEEMNNKILMMSDEIAGTSTNALDVRLVDDIKDTLLVPNTSSGNVHTVPAYSDVNEKDDSGKVTKVVTLKITNTSKHMVKLYPMFPGDKSNPVTDVAPQSKFYNRDYNYYYGNMNHYYDGNGDIFAGVQDHEANYKQIKAGSKGDASGGSGASGSGANLRNVRTKPWYQVPQEQGKYCGIYMDTRSGELKLQMQGQFLYFRVNNPFNGEPYYDWQLNGQLNEKDTYKTFYGIDNLSYSGKYIEFAMANNAMEGDVYGAFVYPKLNSINDITIEGYDLSSYKRLMPGDSIEIPFVFVYKLNNKDNSDIQKAISFDIRTSLYQEPTNYTFFIKANYVEELADKLVNNRNTNTYNPTIVNQ